MVDVEVVERRVFWGQQQSCGIYVHNTIELAGTTTSYLAVCVCVFVCVAAVATVVPRVVGVRKIQNTALVRKMKRVRKLN